MNDKLELGWEEWLGLPGLGLPAIKAKIDTGAKTSALHALELEPFGPANNRQLRFTIHPNPENPQLAIVCSAKIKDQREIKSSNGETELRYVIETEASCGDVKWPIELTLTNRSDMAYKMLLGRSSISENMIVNPNESFIQPSLDYDSYAKVAKRKSIKRPLRIALLTREPKNYTSRRIVEAAEKAGHIVDPIDTSRCYMALNAIKPEIYYDGEVLPRYDAVIPRIGASMTFYGMAIVRQFDMIGTYCLNKAEGIGSSRDKLEAHQLLARHHIEMPLTTFASSPKDTKSLVKLAGSSPLVVKLLESTHGKGVVLAETPKAAESLIDAFRGLEANFLVQEFIKEAGGADIRVLVIGGRVVGAMMRQAAEGEFRSNLHRGGKAIRVRLTKEERSIAVKAAKVFRLGVAGVDLIRSDAGPKVLEVNSSPGFEGIEAATKKDIAGLLIEHLEARVPVLRRQKL